MPKQGPLSARRDQGVDLAGSRRHCGVGHHPAGGEVQPVLAATDSHGIALRLERPWNEGDREDVGWLAHLAEERGEAFDPETADVGDGPYRIIRIKGTGARIE